jgi:sugar phosphate permease
MSATILIWNIAKGIGGIIIGIVVLWFFFRDY